MHKFFSYPITHPLKTILFSIITCILLSLGISQIEFKNSYRIFFSPQNPDLQEFDKFEKLYNKTDNLLFVIKDPTGSVFNTKTLEVIKYLTEEAWKLRDASRVDSITNYQHSFAKGDELIVQSLVEKDPKNLTKSEIDKIKNIVLSEPLLVKRIISLDGSTTGIQVTFRIPENDIKAAEEITNSAKILIKQAQEKFSVQNLEIKISGIVPLNNAFSESSQKDGQTLIPLMFLFIIILIFATTRTLTGTFATILVCFFSIIAGLGISGFVGLDLSSVTASVPNIILTVAIADSIHILIIAINNMKNGMEKKTAILKSVELNFKAVMFTNITTIIGFLGLNFSEVPPFKDLGNMVSFGILICLILTFTLLPAVLSLLPVRIGKVADFSKIENKISHKLSQFIIKNSGIIIVITVAFTVLMTFFVFTKIDIDDNPTEYFAENTEFRQSSDFMMKNLTGLQNIEFSVGAQNIEGISDPQYLQNLEKFHQWLEGQEEVFHVSSIIDIMKRLNKNLHSDNKNFYKIPENKEMTAQYLLLYEMSLPYGLDLTDRINIDKSSSRVTIILKDIPASKIRHLVDKSNKWQQENLPQYMQSKATGANLLFAYISERNIKSMLNGNITSTLTICVLIAFLFKSVRVGFISFLPNSLPIFAAVGIWALLIGKINMGVALISSITFGIIVDDTIHMLNKFYYAKEKLKYNIEESIVYAFKLSGEAIFITTVILVGGFSILAFSDFMINRYTGILSAITISLALLYDIFALPAFLNLIYRKSKK